MSILLICHTTKATTMNAMTALRNAPQRIATSSPDRRRGLLQDQLEVGELDAAEQRGRSAA